MPLLKGRTLGKAPLIWVEEAFQYKQRLVCMTTFIWDEQLATATIKSIHPRHHRPRGESEGHIHTQRHTICFPFPTSRLCNGSVITLGLVLRIWLCLNKTQNMVVNPSLHNGRWTIVAVYIKQDIYIINIRVHIYVYYIHIYIVKVSIQYNTIQYNTIQYNTYMYIYYKY